MKALFTIQKFPSWEGCPRRADGVGLCLLIILFLILPSSAAVDVVSGFAIDSVTHDSLAGAKVKIPAVGCSTVTDSYGKFSLSIVTTSTGFKNSASSPGMRILWDPEKGFLNPNLSVRVVSLNGRVMRQGEKFSSGPCLAICHGSKSSGVFEFMNIAGQPQTFSLSTGEGDEANGSLAKALVATYGTTFSLTGYKDRATSLPANQIQVVPLSPNIVLSDSAHVNLGITINPPGEVNVGVIFTDSTVLIP